MLLEVPLPWRPKRLSGMSLFQEWAGQPVRLINGSGVNLDQQPRPDDVG